MSNNDAIRLAKPLPLPEKIDGFSLNRESFEITSNDPVMKFANFTSAYKLFSFYMDKQDSFEIEVISFCDCLGFYKHILAPISYVFDKNGNNIAQKVVRRTNGGVGTISLHLSGKAPLAGQYYLLTAADNSNPGKIVSKEGFSLLGVTYVPIPTGVSVVNHSNPFGKIVPSYKLNKSIGGK